MNFSGGFSIFGVLVLIADIYAILNILQSGEENLKKAVWCALVIVLPFAGFALWYFLGPRSGRSVL